MPGVLYIARSVPCMMKSRVCRRNLLLLTFLKTECLSLLYYCTVQKLCLLARDGIYCVLYGSFSIIYSKSSQNVVKDCTIVFNCLTAELEEATVYKRTCHLYLSFTGFW